jgi:N-acetylglutamate synthase-like GNAT family acetyltransferase
MTGCKPNGNFGITLEINNESAIRLREDTMPEQMMQSQPIALIPGSVQIRCFQIADRLQIMRLYMGVPLDSDGYECPTESEQIEEKYFRRPQDHFWVADAHGHISGTIAIRTDDQHVALMSCLQAVDDSADHIIRRSLVQAAANHARRHGCLKLVVCADVDVVYIAWLLHQVGFEFSRHRKIQHQSILEFYLNLYEPPELGAGASVPSYDKRADLLIA